MKKPKEPRTPAQWQLVVNMAQASLQRLEAWRYGLVQERPDVDERRCLDLLVRGKAHGWVPRDIAECGRQ